MPKAASPISLYPCPPLSRAAERGADWVTRVALFHDTRHQGQVGTSEVEDRQMHLAPEQGGFRLPETQGLALEIAQRIAFDEPVRRIGSCRPGPDLNPSPVSLARRSGVREPVHVLCWRPAIQPPPS